MRADRLLSILMLLQNRGRLTAQELAAELEVSERTIYRDMVALSSAGVPVYTERGPGGGCSIVESYRTNLTGLKRDEVRALLMLSVPAPLTELGFDQDLKTALLKLSAALPKVFHPEGARVRQRIHLDSTSWFHQELRSAHLGTILEGLWQDRKLKLVYQLAFGAQAEHLVDPYGLVAKMNQWYLVFSANREILVRKLSDVINAEISQEGFDYPTDFELVKYWADWCKTYEANRPHFEARVRLRADLIQMLEYFQDPLMAESIGEYKQDRAGWKTLTLQFESFETARERLLNFGCAAEVLEPISLRRSIQDFASQILAVYGS